MFPFVHHGVEAANALPSAAQSNWMAVFPDAAARGTLPPGAWYRTQKEHWLGWLHDYEGPGAYGRAIGRSRDARFAYNHIVCPGMLLWLGEAAGVEPERVAAARAAAEGLPTQMHQAAAIRRHVPWSIVYAALFG